ncbi:MAG: glycogen debranching protein GlgX [Cyanobacteria bacterium CRU_2_1]|nr:glycogen debranching protein GlgX [Cyanobacteria bacterium RU_5_0]NJR61045.1 glycogen debranching protein GlgX [Cyanobacteria bacterium CRU_2_1]
MGIHHTYSYGDFMLLRGQPFPFGASPVLGGVNFSVYSNHATAATLVLFKKGVPEPFAEIPFPREFRLGNVASMLVLGLDYADIEYGYRVDGPYDLKVGHRFDKSKILLDPYAKSIGGRDVWGEIPRDNDIYSYRARVEEDDFEWEDDRPLELPEEDLIIYEMHVRGFTRHSSSNVTPERRGTYAGLIEKIPYLKSLGVNCIELMPIFEFDELDNPRHNPLTGDRLFNYWGYSTIGFYAPKVGYAASGREGGQVRELKTLVKELHRNGIEVMLDVVFNHTAEGNEHGPTISFRGLDNKTYYMLTPEGYYLNFSGCGNTLNCNHPVVRFFVLDCLRYWASEYHIDGFRFDLASILGRDPKGVPLANPPLLENLAFDPILAKCKLVAEAWDAGGLYQVGSFPDYDRWGEWNGKYRDDIRKFIKSAGSVKEIAQRLQGSPDLYAKGARTVDSSVNFITAHDGFTLMDLVSYNEKHNEANGEENQDGANDNESWNCGEEGITTDPEVNALRWRQMRNAIAILMVSQGVPMILMGDEMGRTQYGNNNAYCHDSELTWLDWNLLETNAAFFRFVKNCIAFRNLHPALRNHQYFRNEDYMGSGYADITWHGVNAWEADWDDDCHTLAFMLCGKHAKGGTAKDDFIYVAMNMHWEAHGFGLPKLPIGMKWHIFVNTFMQPPEDSWDPKSEPALAEQTWVMVGERSVVILVGR